MVLISRKDTAGAAGASESGDSEGGRGRGFGPGGNAFTGDTGRASGGDIINEGGAIDSTAASSEFICACRDP